MRNGAIDNLLFVKIINNEVRFILLFSIAPSIQMLTLYTHIAGRANHPHLPARAILLVGRQGCFPDEHDCDADAATGDAACEISSTGLSLP